MTEQTKAFTANWAVKHDKKLHLPGVNQKPLMLTKDQAAPLLVLGAITECEQQPTETDNKQTKHNSEPVVLTDEQKKIKVMAAIDSMDLTNEENTIASGAPDANKLSELVGFDVSAALRNEVWQITVGEASDLKLADNTDPTEGEQA